VLTCCQITGSSAVAARAQWACRRERDAALLLVNVKAIQLAATAAARAKLVANRLAEAAAKKDARDAKVKARTAAAQKEKLQRQAALTKKAAVSIAAVATMKAAAAASAAAKQKATDSKALVSKIVLRQDSIAKDVAATAAVQAMRKVNMP